MPFVFSVLLCCCSCYRYVFSFVCMFFQCLSIFSPLCSCASQALLDRIKIVYVTAFLLMKNVLRHGRGKKCQPVAQKQKNFKSMLMLQPLCSPTSAALFLDAVLPVLPFPHLNMYSISRLIFMECQTAC